MNNVYSVAPHINPVKLGLHGLLTEPIWLIVFVLMWYVWDTLGLIFQYRKSIGVLVLYSNNDFMHLLFTACLVPERVSEGSSRL